jgi:hypothetical protein
MRCKVQQLARYYLAELWGDSDFRADWERIKTKLSQDAELTELWQRVENPDLSFEERMRADCKPFSVACLPNCANSARVGNYLA